MIPTLPWTLFRMRLWLRPRESVRIPPNQIGMFYAMLCDASARATGREPAMPDGVFLNAPDQAVCWVGPSFGLTLGLTILSPTETEGRQLAIALIDGLRTLGKQPGRGQRLKSFTIETIWDAIANRRVQTAGMISPLPIEHLQNELEQLSDRAELTLQFQTPFRCSLPKNRRTDGHRYLDDTYFSGTLLLSRLAGRLTQLGLDTSSDDSVPPRVIANELVWLDMGYGFGKDRKTLGGAVGRVQLGGLTENHRLQLILGQYTRVGENTRFGFGEYRIAELGADPFPIARTRSLMEHAIEGGDTNRISQEMDLDSGVLSQSLSAVRNGAWHFDPHLRVEIRKPDGGTRTLSIPSRRDRAVQRVVLPTLAEGIDGFLESSSMAYRRGLGRNQAAHQIKRSFREGYTWAIKADFTQFFDNVDHDFLRRRLNAYLSDNLTVDWLMQAVSTSEKGLPTGSPLSPVLANLFLDQFDERIQSLGARLTRYADDFLILCRTSEDARRLFEAARGEAERLRLSLNEDKSKTVDFGSSFVFLGFRFFRREEWEFDEPAGPQLLDDIAWTPERRTKPKTETEDRLPGESDWDTTFRQSTVIVGDDYERIRCEGHAIVFESRQGKPPIKLPTDQVMELIVGERTQVDWSTMETLARAGARLFQIEDHGRIGFEMRSDTTSARAELVIAQVRLTEDYERRLQVARQLASSKIHNYGCLARLEFAGRGPVAKRLFELSEQANRAESIESLLGTEGAAAALWYGRFGELIGRQFVFERRVAPDASDPINVMLNIGQTLLHRWLQFWIERAGMVDTLGCFHSARAGHAALASDLQEPFRHIVDRSVLIVSRTLQDHDFVAEPHGPFPLKIGPRARVQLLEQLARCFGRSVVGCGQHEPRSYRDQMRWLCCGFAHWLELRNCVFQSFWHPKG